MEYILYISETKFGLVQYDILYFNSNKCMKKFDVYWKENYSNSITLKTFLIFMWLKNHNLLFSLTSVSFCFWYENRDSIVSINRTKYVDSSITINSKIPFEIMTLNFDPVSEEFARVYSVKLCLKWKITYIFVRCCSMTETYYADFSTDR